MAGSTSQEAYEHKNAYDPTKMTDEGGSSQCLTVTQGQFRTSPTPSRRSTGVNEDVQATIKQVADTVMGLQGAWTGAAATAFQNMMIRFNDDATKLNQALLAIAEQLGRPVAPTSSRKTRSSTRSAACPAGSRADLEHHRSPRTSHSRKLETRGKTKCLTARSRLHSVDLQSAAGSISSSASKIQGSLDDLKSVPGPAGRRLDR